MIKITEAWTDARLDELCQTINQAMYLSDPMSTCCVENECTDEYFAIAESAVNYMLQGETQRQAIKHALRDSFDVLATDEKVELVLAQLKQDEGKS